MALYLKDGKLLYVGSALAHSSNCCCTNCTGQDDYCCIQGETTYIPCDLCTEWGGAILQPDPNASAGGGSDSLDPCEVPCSDTVGECCNGDTGAAMDPLGGCDCSTLGGFSIPLGETCPGEGSTITCCFGAFTVSGYTAQECAGLGGQILTAATCEEQTRDGGGDDGGNGYLTTDCCATFLFQQDRTYYTCVNALGQTKTYQLTVTTQGYESCNVSHSRCVSTDGSLRYNEFVMSYDAFGRVISTSRILRRPELKCVGQTGCYTIQTTTETDQGCYTPLPPVIVRSPLTGFNNFTGSAGCTTC